MKKTLIIFFIVLLILVFLIGIFLNKLVFTGYIIKENLGNYSWTRAVCNSDNECIDVLIFCEDEKVARIEPVSELVKLDENWTDLREKEELCE